MGKLAEGGVKCNLFRHAELQRGHRSIVFGVFLFEVCVFVCMCVFVSWCVMVCVCGFVALSSRVSSLCVCMLGCLCVVRVFVCLRFRVFVSL